MSSKNIYIGIDDNAHKIKNIYVGVDGEARKIIKAFYGVNGVAKQIYAIKKPGPDPKPFPDPEEREVYPTTQQNIDLAACIWDIDYFNAMFPYPPYGRGAVYEFSENGGKIRNFGDPTKPGSTYAIVDFDKNVKYDKIIGSPYLTKQWSVLPCFNKSVNAGYSLGKIWETPAPIIVFHNPYKYQWKAYVYINGEYIGDGVPSVAHHYTYVESRNAGGWGISRMYSTEITSGLEQDHRSDTGCTANTKRFYGEDNSFYELPPSRLYDDSYVGWNEAKLSEMVTDLNGKNLTAGMIWLAGVCHRVRVYVGNSIETAQPILSYTDYNDTEV